MLSMCMSHLDDGLLVSAWKILSFPLGLLPLSHHLRKKEKHQLLLYNLLVHVF